jgi:CRP/FNR family transcriptional regulator
VGTKKALPRVASCLLLFMEKQVEPGQSRPFNLPISRQEMGAFLGLSPETVSRQLKDLTTSRVIRLEHRRLTVLDLGHLKSIAQV